MRLWAPQHILECLLVIHGVILRCSMWLVFVIPHFPPSHTQLWNAPLVAIEIIFLAGIFKALYPCSGEMNTALFFSINCSCQERLVWFLDKMLQSLEQDHPVGTCPFPRFYPGSRGWAVPALQLQRDVPGYPKATYPWTQMRDFLDWVAKKWHFIPTGDNLLPSLEECAFSWFSLGILICDVRSSHWKQKLWLSKVWNDVWIMGSRGRSIWWAEIGWDFEFLVFHWRMNGKSLTGGCVQAFFPRLFSQGTTGNGLELCQGRFALEIKKNLME